MLWPFAFLIPLLIGLVFTSLLWPDQRARASHLFFKLSLAAGIGTGLFSCFFFVWLLVTNTQNRGFMVAALLLLAGLGYVLHRRSRGSAAGTMTLSDSRPWLHVNWVLLIAVVVAFALAIASYTLLSLNRPHGEWDAWAIWNMRARFLFRGGEHWRDAFSPLINWSHPDYPPLLPAAIAGLWTCVGSESTRVPVVVSGLFAFSTAGLLVSSLSTLRGKSNALLAGVVLLGTPFFISHAANQYADVTLGFFYLATYVLLATQDAIEESSRRLLVLAGVAAGFAAFTKNEGLLFVPAVITTRLIAMTFSAGWKSSLRQGLSFAIGLVPVAALVLFFKLTLAPPSYLVARPGTNSVIERLRDGERYELVFSTFGETVPGFGKWSIGILLVLVIYPLIVGVSVPRQERAGLISLAVSLCGLLAGYLLVFVITPLDLQWQLSTSLNRLLLQLWPSFLFGLFLTARPLEQIARQERVASG
jgi:hypothetical protein